MAHRGFDVVEVRLRGRAAHSSQPERGVDTIRQLGRLLAAVEQHDHELSARAAHAQAGHGSLLATVLVAGSAPFTIADQATVIIERRTLPSEPGGTGFAEVEGLLADLGAIDGSLDAAAEMVLSREAWQSDLDTLTEVMLSELDAGLVRAGQLPPDRSGAPYWMESAIWGAAGVPSVICGPAGGGMYAVDEWLDLGQLRAFTTAVHGLIHRICGG